MSDQGLKSGSLLPALADDKLAEVEDTSSALVLRDRVLTVMQQATMHIVNQVDEFIAELEDLKAHLIESGGMATDVVRRHFDVGAETLAFRDKVKRRLQGAANGNRETEPDAAGDPFADFRNRPEAP